MNTYRQLVYMVYDELKINSDDSIWEVDHLIFLLNKYRALLIKQRYGAIKKVIPQTYFQTLDVVMSTSVDKSIKQVPSTIELNNSELFFSANTASEDVSRRVILVPASRFPYVQINKWLNKVVYCSIKPDKYLHIKCMQDRPSIISLTVILENPLDELTFKASTINPLDMDFPMETSAIHDVISLVAKELGDSKVIPDVEKNNATEENLMQKPQRNDR